ncbi:TMhelix containing protein [Vibrio phage 1.264.O._10N.286.51.F2]|nr:TMhelix containing protein [Vibrio phage 1.264.O._10N.286.51.F2]
MIIPAIAGWFKEKRKSFAKWRFEFGMLVTALVVGAYYYSSAIYKFLMLDKKDSPSEHLDRLLEQGDKSIDIFLNQLQIMLPDKWRQLLGWEAGYP